MSKGLEALNDLYNGNLTKEYKLQCYKDIEKELKALKIISEKEVNVAWFTYISSVEEYNKGKCIGSYLTEQEFNLLKEVLL